MCRRVSCSKCGKPTWAGCGAHIEQVLGNVPMAQRCNCREQARAAKPEVQAQGSPDAGGGAMAKFLRFIKGGD